MKRQQDTLAALDVIEAGRQVIRPIVLEYFTADSCVATVRITIDVLAYFGITARPAAVETLIFNGEAYSMLREGATPEEIGRAVHARSTAEIGGPWTVGLGFGDSPESTGRHMVAWVPSESLCLDFSLDQASREQKAMALGPATFRMPGPLTLEEGNALPVGHVFSGEIPQVPPHGSAHLEYRVVEDWFRGSPNWRRTSAVMSGAPATFRDITGRAIRAIREHAGQTSKR